MLTILWLWVIYGTWILWFSNLLALKGLIWTLILWMKYIGERMIVRMVKSILWCSAADIGQKRTTYKDTHRLFESHSRYILHPPTWKQFCHSYSILCHPDINVQMNSFYDSESKVTHGTEMTNSLSRLYKCLVLTTFTHWLPPVLPSIPLTSLETGQKLCTGNITLYQYLK